MAVKTSQKRTRRIPLVLFLVYGLFALLIACIMVLWIDPGFRTVMRLIPIATPTSTAVTGTPTPTVGVGTPVPTSAPVVGPAFGTPDNPLGLPLWSLQLLFGITAISGVASMVRWAVGAASTLARFVGRK